MKIKLTEIKVMDLNSRTVILLTQFVRLARLRDGADLKMQYPDLVRRVFKYASITENPDLIVLFMRIRLQVENSMLQGALKQPH